MNYESISEDSVTIIESKTETCHATVGDINKYINVKTANANLLNEWINALEINGTDSYVYKNDYMMRELLNSGFFRNSDIAKYYAIVWAGNNNVSLVDYLEYNEKFSVTHKQMGDIEWEVLVKNWENDGTVTFRMSKIAQLMPFDAKEPTTPDSSDYTFTDTSGNISNRKKYGNNRWSVSNIRLWLNSVASDGNWFSKQHDYDESPNGSNIWINSYTSWAGFLAGFPSEFVSAIKATTKRTALNTVIDAIILGKTYEDTTDKIWLLSRYELNLGTEAGIIEGSVVNGTVIQKPYPCFTDNTSRLLYPNEYCLAHNDNYTTSAYGDGKTWTYWMRSPLSGNSYAARRVWEAGPLGGNNAYGGGIGLAGCLRI